MDKSFPVLKTERLVLRQITEQDSMDMMEYFSDPEVMKYYGLQPFHSKQEALDEVEWYTNIFQTNIGIRWGITLAGQDKLIGSCGFHNRDKRHHRTDIGYELAREYWNKGIMAEAIKAVVTYGYTNYEINRVQALVEPENMASRRLLEKVGFKEEGLLYEYEFSNGKYDDLIMYSLLKKNFL